MVTVMHRWMRAASAALLLPAACTPAQAAQCGKRADLIKGFEQQFGEKRSGIGLTSNGQVFELYVAPNGTSWTILSTRVDGLACIVAVGRSWEQVKKEDPET